MIELICPQCRTKLPVAEEKIGKTLFVCPSCSFPLDAPNGASDPVPPVVAGGYGGYAPPAAPPMPMRLSTPAPIQAPIPAPIQAPSRPTEITLTEAPTLRPIKVPVKAPRKNAGPPPPPAASQAPASRRVWLIGGGAAAGTALLAGVLFLFFTSPPKKSSGSGQETVEKPKMGLLEVLARSDDLQSEDPEKRVEAAIALGEAGPDAKAAVPALLDALRERNDKARGIFANALDQIGAPAESDFPALSAALRDEDEDVKAYALSVLPSQGEKSWGEIEQVRLLTQDEDPQVRAEAELTLEQLEKDIVDKLTARLKDRDEKVRSKAAEGLGDLGVSAADAKASLMTAMADENEAVRAAVSKALTQFGAEVVPMLAEALRNPNVVARRAAVAALGTMKEEAVDAIPQIAELVDDPDIGDDAARALVNDFGELAVPAVAAVMGQTNVAVRRNFLLNKVLIPIGPAALPALNVYITRNRDIRMVSLFSPMFNRFGRRFDVPAVVAPAGRAGEHFRDFTNRFREWDDGKGFLDHRKVTEGLKMDPAAFSAFLKRVDRDGDGKISRHEYERWAHDQARQMAKEEAAQKAVHEANAKLHDHVAADRKKALQDAHANLKSINAEKAKHPDARKAAEAHLSNQRRNTQKQHVSAQNAALKKQHELAKVQRHQSPVAKQMAPHKPSPPKTQTPKKPANRPPVVKHPAGHPAAAHAPKGGGGGKKKR